MVIFRDTVIKIFDSSLGQLTKQNVRSVHSVRNSDEGRDKQDYRPSLSAKREQLDSSDRFGRYRLSERFVGHDETPPTIDLNFRTTNPQ